MRRRLTIATLLVTVLVVTAVIGSAATNTALGSVHTTDTDFNNALEKTNLSVTGTGNAANLTLSDLSRTYNVVSDSGDGTTDSTTPFVGDDSGNSKIDSEWKIKPTFVGTVDNLTVEIGSTAGADYGFTVDVYAVQENPDGVYGEGTVINSSWDPDFSTGVQTIELDTRFDVEAGQNWTIEFVTSGSDGDGTNDILRLREDTSLTNWHTATLGSDDGGGNITVNGLAKPTTATYISQNHSVSRPTTGFTNLSQLDNSTAVVTWEYAIGGTWQQEAQNTYTTPGNKTAALSTDADTWRVNVTYHDGYENLSTQATLSDEGLLFTNHDPVVDNNSASPSGGSQSSQSSVTLSIDVNDSEFPTAQGDSVSVEFFKNESDETSFTSIGTDTLTSNGTAQLSETFNTGGSVQWYAWANDSYAGTQQSQTFTFETPANVTFRNESNATQVITGASATATFYSADGTTIIEKTDTDGDGNISLAGLPVGNEFVIVVEADNWYTRRTYIESIFEQSNIFLLNSTAYPNAIDTTFVYEDRTGDFPPEDTTLRIQRAVDVDGDDTYNWSTVAGDFWGAAGEFPFTGQTNARYRLIIENADGTQRNLGTHIPTADGTKNVIVGQLTWPGLNGTGRQYAANLSTDTNQILAAYKDPNDNTTEVRIQVYEYQNATNEIFDQNFTSGPYGTLQSTIGLTAAQTDQSWTVEFTAQTGDGEQVSKLVVGSSAATSLPLDPWLLGTFGWLGLTFAACLYGPRTATGGAWTVVLLAGVLMLFQWVDIPLGSFIAAGGVAVAGTIWREAL